MCKTELPIPTSLVDWSHLTLFHHGDMSPYTIGIFRQTNFSQEAIRLTAGDGGPSTGCQTHSNA